MVLSFFQNHTPPNLPFLRGGATKKSLIKPLSFEIHLKFKIINYKLLVISIPSS